jgi:hypothetical protein
MDDVVMNDVVMNVVFMNLDAPPLRRSPGIRFDQLDDVLPIIFEFLPNKLKDIMDQRLVCKKWKQVATKRTAILELLKKSMKWDPAPHSCVVKLGRRGVSLPAMMVMTAALPNMQQITLRDFGWDPDKWSDGEDPDEEQLSRTADCISHDIGIISNFSRLSILEINAGAFLNGRYPSLFNFPLLQKLSIIDCTYLKLDLDMFAGLPLLKELECDYTSGTPGLVTGNIESLRVLKGTLEKVKINFCPHVEGSFMDLADFPHLKVLDLYETTVTGDLRYIRETHFLSLVKLILPESVYGALMLSSSPTIRGGIHAPVQRAIRGEYPAGDTLQNPYNIVH